MEEVLKQIAGEPRKKPDSRSLDSVLFGNADDEDDGNEKRGPRVVVLIVVGFGEIFMICLNGRDRMIESSPMVLLTQVFPKNTAGNFSTHSTDKP